MKRTGLHIIDFNDDLSPLFKQLNVAWLQKYFIVEPIDEEMLGNPKHFIIDKGGAVFFAELDGEIVGTFALMKSGEVEFELGKMAVDESFQGQKIGHKMLEFAIQKAGALGGQTLVLFSNTKLTPAIHLYKKFGFIEVPLQSSEYKRSNIKMEKRL
ncbi:MAG TPA: GNAT family N-acetyltransferase [Chitinophagaceae bacterium]|jgi:ribosomal protein S18 acetylase RimI-like enzyme|nr:GNAT family N-acetyltransferase [Chitinophagaceae bacterium]